MGFTIGELGWMEFHPCECCAPKYTTYTTSTSTHKWTREEIEGEIIWLSQRLLEKPWYDRGNTRRQLKHWVDKLEQYKSAEQEFAINKQSEEDN